MDPRRETTATHLELVDLENVGHIPSELMVYVMPVEVLGRLQIDIVEEECQLRRIRYLLVRRIVQ